jgi:hypothetical protein
MKRELDSFQATCSVMFDKQKKIIVLFTTAVNIFRLSLRIDKHKEITNYIKVNLVHLSGHILLPIPLL